jgi:hypothetical protein
MYTPQTRIIRHGLAGVDWHRRQPGPIIAAALADATANYVDRTRKSRMAAIGAQNELNDYVKSVQYNDRQFMLDEIKEETAKLAALRGADPVEIERAKNESFMRLQGLSAKSQNDLRLYGQILEEAASNPYNDIVAIKRILDDERTKPLTDRPGPDGQIVSGRDYEGIVSEIRDGKYFSADQFVAERLKNGIKVNEVIHQRLGDSFEIISNNTINPDVVRWNEKGGMYEMLPEVGRATVNSMIDISGLDVTGTHRNHPNAVMRRILENDLITGPRKEEYAAAKETKDLDVIENFIESALYDRIQKFAGGNPEAFVKRDPTQATRAIPTIKPPKTTEGQRKEASVDEENEMIAKKIMSGNTEILDNIFGGGSKEGEIVSVVVGNGVVTVTKKERGIAGLMTTKKKEYRFNSKDEASLINDVIVPLRVASNKEGRLGLREGDTKKAAAEFDDL